MIHRSALLQQYVDFAGPLSFVKDSEHRVIAISTDLAAMMGRSPEELKGRRFGEFLDTADARALEETERLIIAGECRVSGSRWSFAGPNDDEVEFVAEMAPLFGDDDDIVGVLGQLVTFGTSVSRDAIEQTNGRRRAGASATYRTVFENTGTAVALIEEDGTLSLVNQKFTDLVGIPRDQIENRRKFTDFIAPAEPPRLSNHDEACRLSDGEGPPSYEHDLIDSRGQRIRVLVTMGLIPDTSTTVASSIDITEHVQTRRALTQSERRFHDLVDMLPQVVFETDAQGKLTYVNQGAFDLYGYDPAEYDDVAALSMIAPEDRERAMDDFQRLLRGDQLDLAAEYLALREDDSRLPVMVCANLVANDREASGVRGIVVDISKRKTVERELRESKEELEAIYANAPVALMVVDGQRRIRKVNGFVEDFAGAGAVDLLGKTGGEALRCLHHLDHPAGCGYGDACQSCTIRKTVLSTLQMGDAHRHIEASLPFMVDGQRKELTFLVSTALLRHKDEPMVLVALDDITERKKAGEQVRELSQFREAVIEQASLWLTVLDLDGSVLVWNRAAEETSGYEATQMVGSNCFFECLFEEEAQRREVREMIAQVFDRNEPLANFVTPITTRDGQRRIMSWNARAILDDDDEAMCVMALGVDVTEQVALEKRVCQKQKMEAIGHLAAGVAHDFNNVLQMIMGPASLVLEEAEDLSEVHRRDLSSILTACERGSSLTRRIHIFSQGIKLVCHPIPPEQSIADAVDLLSRTLPGTVELTSEAAPGLWSVVCERHQLAQVLINLCVNASEAMPDGGSLNIRALNYVHRNASPDGPTGMVEGEYVKLSVCDTGCGIPEDHLPFILDPFYTTKSRATHSGLGLAVVQGIVAYYDGYLDVQSDVREGTTVSVYLPRASNQAADRAREAEDHSRNQSRSLRVLVVDDEQLVVNAAAGMLTHLGHESVDFTDPVDALNWFEREHESVDLVLLDWVMPKMTGNAALEQLLAIDPKVRVAVATGHLMQEEAMAALAEKGISLVRKPFSISKLASVVSDVR